MVSHLFSIIRFCQVPTSKKVEIAKMRLSPTGEKNPFKSSVKLGEEEAIEHFLFFKVAGLVNLAPDIVEAVMEEPPAFDFSIKKLFSRRLPDDWNEQRKFLGLRKKNYAR